MKSNPGLNDIIRPWNGSVYSTYPDARTGRFTGVVVYRWLDDDEIAYFTVRWKTRELVLSTAPKTWDNTDKDSKNRKRPH